MSFAIRLRLVLAIFAAIVVAQFLFAGAARAQSQDDSQGSVADAAKRALERKKDAASAKKVITDDDLNPINLKPGDEGLKVSTPKLETEPPSPAAVAADEAADKKAETSPADNPLKSTDPAKVAALKEELAQAEESLKLSQRESALQQDTYYTNPDYQHDDAGKAKLAELQQLINDHQQAVEELRARLAALQESLSKHPPAPEKPATPPQS
jgi:FtsZ-interacting cell division protein ZipA